MPLKPTTESAIDYGSLFDEDWQKAQARYANYVRMSYTKPEQDFIGSIGRRVKRMGGTQSDVDAAVAEATQQVEAGKAKEADQLYLLPLREKWKIIQSNPAGFQTQSKIDQISSDFDTATESAVKGLDKDEPIELTVSKRFQPLAQRWAVEAAKPALPFEQQETLKEIEREINGIKSKNLTYQSMLIKEKDPENIAGINSSLNINRARMEDLQKQKESILSPVSESSTKSTSPAMPSQQSGFTALRQPDNVVGYTGDISDYVAPTEAQPTAPAAPERKPLIFISGRPDLSRYGNQPISREEADAAWAARFNRPQRPTPVDREEVESPANRSNVPSVGDIKKGYRFKGGDPSKKENWEKV